ncbi:S41 family peptidase [Ekhidna sp.]
MKRKYLVLIFSTLSLFLYAQNPSEKLVDRMVITITDQIKSNYVLPEKGELIADYFLKDHKNGRFSQASTLKELDSIMCKSLFEISKDHHLYVWNNYDVVNQLKSEKIQKEDSEEKESLTFFNNEKAYQSNFGFERIEILDNNIGYLRLSQINISDHSLKKLYAAMNIVEHTDALIIDLKNNGGGGSTVGSVLETYFFDEHLDLLEFRSRNDDARIESTVEWLLENRYLKPLYILINKGTASAAEAFAFALQHQKRCTIVGQASSGGAYMNTYFPVNDDFVIAISTSAPFLPGTNVSWEGEGVRPDVLTDIGKEFDTALKLLNE